MAKKMKKKEQPLVTYEIHYKWMARAMHGPEARITTDLLNDIRSDLALLESVFLIQHDWMRAESGKWTKIFERGVIEAVSEHEALAVQVAEDLWERKQQSIDNEENSDA